MPTIIDLPNELLCFVIQVIDPFDLEAFVLSNKHFYAMAKPALDRHLARKESYSSLQWGITGTLGIKPRNRWSKRPIECRSALCFLAKLLERPDFALYPRTMDVGEWDDESKDFSDYEEADLEGYRFDKELVSVRQLILANHGTQLRAMVGNCGLIAPHLKTDMWDYLCHPFDNHAAFCLLIHMLPNLKTLALTDWSFQADMLHDIVQRAAMANRDSGSALME